MAVIGLLWYAWHVPSQYLSTVHAVASQFSNEITVESERHIVNNGKLLNISDPMLIGTPIQQEIQVVIIGKIALNYGTLIL